VDEGFAGRSTKRPQCFWKEIQKGRKITMEQSIGENLSIKFNEDKSRTELGQLHMRDNVDVFGEKDSHMREYKRSVTPGLCSVSPKDDSKRITAGMQLEHKSGVRMLLYQTAHKASFNWIKLVVCTKTWKLMKMMKLKNGTLQWNSDSDWHDYNHKRSTINGCIICECDSGWVFWKTVFMSSKEEKRAISDAAMLVLQVLRKMNKQVGIPIEVLVDSMGLICLSEGTNRCIGTRHVDARFHLVQEQVTEPVVEIKFVKTDGNRRNDFTVRGEVLEGHQKDVVRDKRKCRHAALAHLTETKLVVSVSTDNSWSSVGRVSEISLLDSGSDAHAVS